MRISNTMMMKKYAQLLNDKYENINKYSNQMSSTRAFERASDDPVAAMKSIKACHEYTMNKQYQSSATQAQSWVQATESTVTQVNSIFKSAQEKATEMLNGTNSDSDLQNYAVAMKSYRDEIVSTLNQTYAGQYIFGGSSSGNPPFKLDGSGNLQYYDYKAATPGYVNISSIQQGDVAGMKLSLPVDVGLGLSYSGGTIDQSSYFESATSGLDVIISGYDCVTGGGKNIVDQLSSMITALNNNDKAGLSTAIGDIGDAQNAVLKVKVAIGEKSKMLTAISNRLTDNESNITNALANSMEVDSTKAIMQYNISMTSYKESLSISSTILQQSLIDFLK